MVYKTVTKVLANRIQKVLPDLVLSNQSAFISGRGISDNILLAQELVCGYARSTLSARCAVKVDFKKAFDSLDWDFILKVLTALKFPDGFVFGLSSVSQNLGFQ